MKLLYSLLACTSITYGMQSTKQEVKIYLDEKLENEVRKSTSNKLLTRGDFIDYLKRQHPEWFNNTQYDIKIVTTFRGASFQVYRKAQEEIEDSIIETYKNK